MAEDWIDITTLKKDLRSFFITNKSEIRHFGNTVNQTFEAFVFATLIKFYSDNGWEILLKHPDKEAKYAKLKFSTRGRPNRYTYAICTKGEERIQLRHGLRVATRHHKKPSRYRANVVLDVAVISDLDLSKYSTDDHVENAELITFGEAKHMSAFAELIASFIGLVHEIKPDHLSPIRSPNGPPKNQKHLAPFLYVSGYLYRTALGIAETIRDRRYDIDIYDQESGNLLGLRLPKMRAKNSKKRTRQSKVKAHQPMRKRIVEDVTTPVVAELHSPEVGAGD
jgi:hypothetical protein